MNAWKNTLAMFRPPRPRHALVLAPHPDDESVGCGGYLSMLADGGAKITVVFVTDGGLNAAGKRDQALVDRRRRESQAAMSVLGIRHAVWWGFEDGGLADCRRPTALLQRLVTEQQVDLILTPHPSESHSDHAAVARMTAELATDGAGRPTVMTYEIWTPQVPNCLVDIGARLDRKLQAIRAYESQASRFNLEGLAEGLGRYRAAWSRMRGWRFAEGFRQFSLDEFRSFCREN